MAKPALIEISVASTEEALALYSDVEKFLTQRGVGTTTLSMRLNHREADRC
jgi:hypothetical protein